MAEVFGEPGARDATAKEDARVNRLSKAFLRSVERASSIYNRPMGSKVLSPTEQREEYMANYKGNPDAHMEALQRFVSQARNPIEGVASWAKWVKKMESENG